MHKGIDVVLKAEPIGHILGFTITNSLLMTWVVMAILLLLAFFIVRNLKMVPGKLQACVEMIFDGAIGYMAQTLENERLARKFFPLLATIFFLVLFSNELEFFPGVGSFGLLEGGVLTPLLRAPTADLNLTLALAFIAFFTIEVTGLSVLGFFKYGGKYINFKSPIGFAVGIIELISNLGRLISFSFRLFGNIFAGEVMILVASYFFQFFLPIPLMAFEVFVGLIQAIVFSMLTLFFIKLAIMEPHGDDHGDEHETAQDVAGAAVIA